MVFFFFYGIIIMIVDIGLCFIVVLFLFIIGLVDIYIFGLDFVQFDVLV